jgi:hypothetical protein
MTTQKRKNVLFVRMTAEEMAQLDRYVEAVRKVSPSLAITKSAVARELIASKLEEAEKARAQ